MDLYRGKVTDKQQEAHQLMMGTPRDRALRDLKAAFAYLGGRADVQKAKRGVVGWCMGGMYAQIKAAILGNYGGDDKGPSPDQVRAFEAAMKKAGKSIDVKLYAGAGHAFANVNNPWGGYREAAAKDAWARTTAFFAQHLKKWARGGGLTPPG